MPRHTFGAPQHYRHYDLAGSSLREFQVRGASGSGYFVRLICRYQFRPRSLARNQRLIVAETPNVRAEGQLEGGFGGGLELGRAPTRPPKEANAGDF